MHGGLGPIIEAVSRYVFSNTDAQDDKALMAAKKTARAHGATVVKSLAGTMLLELEPAKILEVARALPGWRYSAERKKTRISDRLALETPTSGGAREA